MNLKKLQKTIAILLVMATLTVLFAGCGSTTNVPAAEVKPAETAPAPAESKLTENAEASGEVTYSVETLKLPGCDRGAPNPYLQKSGGPADQKVRLIFDSLLNEGETALDPWLAESFTVDGNVYTFKLHENALWHDGEKVTAHDVVFTLDYYKKFTPATQLITSGDYNNFDAEALDDYTVQITAKDNDATTIVFIGLMYILPEHIWKDVTDPMTFTDDAAFIGCGMYKFESYNSAEGTYSYVAFDDYYGPKVAAKKLQFVPVSDGLLAFENGEIDLVDVSADVVDRYENDDSIGFIYKQDDMIYTLFLNAERVPAFADPAVRKAIYQAIDRDAIVNNVFRGYATAGSAGHVSPNNRYYSSDVVEYDYDPEAAKAVLQDLGLSFTITTPNSGFYINSAELIKMNLAEVGVEVTVDVPESGWMAKFQEGNTDAVINGHGMAARTPDYLYTCTNSDVKNTKAAHAFLGSIGISSDRIDELGKKELYAMDEASRKAAFVELQQAVSEELPMLTLATNTYIYMYKKDYYDGWAKSYDYEQFDYCRVSFLEK